jgi:GDP-4-dehydro-6-deoxy-D-mannose reductase
MTAQTPAPPMQGRIGFANILVTGADGFVGGHFVPALRTLVAPEAQLCLTTRTGVLVDGLATAQPFDLEDADSVSALVQARRPDLIVHLAGLAAVGTAHAARDTWSVNFRGSFAMAAAVRDYAPNCTVFFVSSAQVYGRAFDRGPASEDTPPQPISAYARSKLAAELMFDDVLPPTSRLMVMRPSNHTGPGQGADFAVPAFAEQIARLELAGGGELAVGNLEGERDILSVRDVVAAYTSVLSRAETLPERAVFNVASGEIVKMADVLARLLSASRAEIRVRFDQSRARPGDIRRAAVDGSRLRRTLGWRPREALDDALLEVLADYRARAAIGAGSDARRPEVIGGSF